MDSEEIDWQDFVIVEKIELYDDQEMADQQEAYEQITEMQEGKVGRKQALIQQQIVMHMEEN